eukprot:NODE_359_length_8799_cov_0.795172.p7 type:complete len:120 gc:universal NODE_359_length_8799_cov_0.795172:2720-3079(+)
MTNRDFSILRENFPTPVIQRIVENSTDKSIELEALLLLNKSAIFFLGELVAESEGAKEEEMAKTLKNWGFEDFDDKAKKSIQAPIQKTSIPSMQIPGAAADSESAMQRKLMGLLQKKFH